MKVAVLISGTGRTLKNLLGSVDVKVVIASSPAVPGLLHVPAGVRVSTDPATVFEVCEAHEIDLVCMAGWVKKLVIPEKWLGRVMNIHPSLLPAFGGKGMYGKNVHEAVLASGVKESGCTVHYADGEYDTGPVILQKTVPVLDGDTVETLAARVFEQEKIAYPEAIRKHEYSLKPSRQFLEELRERARRYGWDGDWVEVSRFVEDLHREAGIALPKDFYNIE